MALPKTKRRVPLKKKTGKPAAISPQAEIKVVRELRSGYGAYEIVNAVNDLLQRGWILLGAHFISTGAANNDQREFLYVLGSTDPAMLESTDDVQFGEWAANLKDWHHEQ